VIGRGHLDAGEGRRGGLDSGVVGGDDHIAKVRRFAALLDDMLDEWLAGDEDERFAGKSGRSKSCRENADNLHSGARVTTRTWEVERSGPIER